MPKNICSLCRNSSLSCFVRTDAKTFESIEFGECSSCGHVQQLKPPTADALKTFYSHHYREKYKSVHVPRMRHVHRAGTVALERLRVLQAFKEERKTLLDVGAGGGEFVYLANRRGWDATGIEPNLGYSEFARTEYGVEVRTGSLDDEASEHVDVLTMFHVLEHVLDPQASLQRVYERLTPQGLFFVEVPNLIQKDSSPHNIFFKAHVQYFNRDTLLFAASRYFECLAMEDRGNLKAVFKRRDHPERPKLPSPAVVSANATRFRAKGWVEYLLEGGGWMKPFSRLWRSIGERKAKSRTPRQILDQIIESSST